MFKITVKTILDVCNGKLFTNNNESEIENFERNTNNIQIGDMYLAIKGENADGNDFVEVALQNGAIGAIVDKTPKQEIVDKYPEKCIIQVEDTIKAIQQLANYKREKSNIPVVAITGSVGKTSTKDLVASVLSQQFKVLKTEGNYNNHIGLPLTLLKLKEQDIAVVEMGMNHFGEIKTLTNIAKPNVAIFTNIGTSHIGNLGSRENILKAKLEMLEGLDENGKIIINNDNDLLSTWNNNEKLQNVNTYGIHNKSMYVANNIEILDNGSKYELLSEGNTYEITVPVSGEHFVYNSLCAFAAGKIFNIPEEKIIKGIAEFKLTAKRMDIKKIKENITVINDSYNASFDSVKAALEVLKNSKGNRKIAVLGNMLELGEFTQELHEKVGEEVIRNEIDVLITVGEYAKSISKISKEKGMLNVFEYDSINEASEKLKEIMIEEDIILLKASNSMNFSKILEKIV
ncbi:MAG: UDP-N-acetylmuramoyl-tripeptide--D-alanyl-D-alanine ligase [Clostridiales bacterium]|nr:UDP-N-acetylmuramoyl-tripeptide--D-alanyl-D-alanine ligase [Clostridiales bacterium]